MRVQEMIHHFEVGQGSKLMKLITVFIAMLVLALWYDLTAFRNLSTQEGMDTAQLARNIAEGKGYTTDFVRPFSMHLLARHRSDHDPRVKGPHPDLANAPVYPLLLAGVLKLMPFEYPDLTRDTKTLRYVPDLWIAVFNQLLFFIAVLFVFQIGKRLFDEPVGWMSAAVFLGTDLFWRFSISGLSTIWLVVIFLALFTLLARVELAGRAATLKPTGWFVGLGIAAGMLVGIGGLSRYAFASMIVPVLAFFAYLPSSKRPILLASVLAGFIVAIGPWVGRNYVVSGTPFGTAGYGICQNTAPFPDGELERTQNPDFTGLTGSELWHKFLAGARDIIKKDLPALGENWISAFFLAGLLVPFRNPTLSRLRWFLILSVIVFGVATALGRTNLSTDSPEVNSENLLVVLAPAIFIYGVSLFFILLDQLMVHAPAARLGIVAFAVGLASMPLLLTLASPAVTPLVFPLYHPAGIQEKTQSLRPEEWMMSDIAWAVAWYGHRQCVALSLKYRNDPDDRWKNDFYELNDVKPIRALYLSPKTVKAVETESLRAWVYREQDANWEAFVVDWPSFLAVGLLANRQVPTGFPLRQSTGLLPEVFLTDTERNSGKSIKVK